MATAKTGNIGPYRLLNVVHTGQASQIWQAYHDGKGQLFGLKTLLNQFRQNREHLGYLRWEFVVGEKITHDRIVRIYEFDVDRGSPYVAMEWFSALNMKRRILQGIDKIGYLLPQIIDQAAEGLAYLNSLGWVHRDVKPDNFLVSDDGQVKLIDFALAQRSKTGLGRLLAKRTKVQGTRSYMSPEQIRGGAVDIRADVYAFGCMMHELLAGKPPFTGSSSNELLQKHLRSTPPPLEAFNKNIAPEFSLLVRQALSKDPAKRPNSVNEFRHSRVFKIPPQPPEETTDKQTRRGP